MIKLLRNIFNRRERAQGTIVIFAMFLGALFEALGVGLVVPFVLAVSEPKHVFDAPLAAPLLAALDINEPHELLLWVSGVFRQAGEERCDLLHLQIIHQPCQH